jgi:hypothetical protein
MIEIFMNFGVFVFIDVRTEQILSVRNYKIRLEIKIVAVIYCIIGFNSPRYFCDIVTMLCLCDQ